MITILMELSTFFPLNQRFTKELISRNFSSVIAIYSTFLHCTVSVIVLISRKMLRVNCWNFHTVYTMFLMTMTTLLLTQRCILTHQSKSMGWCSWLYVIIESWRLTSFVAHLIWWSQTSSWFIFFFFFNFIFFSTIHVYWTNWYVTSEIGASVTVLPVFCQKKEKRKKNPTKYLLVLTNPKLRIVIFLVTFAFANLISSTQKRW